MLKKDIKDWETLRVIVLHDGNEYRYSENLKTVKGFWEDTECITWEILYIENGVLTVSAESE